ncbi:MAG: hypothetical protein GAK34_01218 [Delftia tsuruhatensis]|nr:MAG: hypothetical protein GAK34_01218 [Delftia tsuruhatensis]
MVGMRALGGVPGRAKQLRQAQAPVQRGAQNLGVHEKAHRALRFHPVAVGNGHAHANVFLARVAVQHGLQARQQQHEQRCVLRLGAAAQAADQFGRQLQAMAGGHMVRAGPARVVGGQLQHGVRVAQLGAPVGQLPLPLAGLQPLALPGRVVGVLQRQGCGLRHLSLAPCAVLLHEFIHDDLHGPAVGDDVVHGHDQQMRLGRLPDQAHAQQRPGLQVEGLAVHGGRRLFQLLLTLRSGESGQIRLLDPHTALCGDHLHHLPVPAHAEHRAQRLVARHQRVEALLQRQHIERAQQTQRAADVIGRTGRLQLPQEPLAQLRKGQRQRATAVGPGQGRRAFGLLGAGNRPLHQPCHTRWRLAREQLLGRELDAALAGARHQLEREDGVPAQREEVVMPARALQAEEVGPDGGQCLLGLALGRLEKIGGRLLRHGQGLAVDLAVGRQGHALQHGDAGGHHVLGQRLRQRGGPPRPVGGNARLGHGIGMQLHAPVPAALPVQPRHDFGLGHAGHGLQRQRHLAQLHAVAAHLHLVVHAAQELQAAIGQHGHAVARAVQALARLERAGHESLCRLPGPGLVAARQARPAQVQLAAGAQGHGLQVGIQHQGAAIGQRPAHGQAFAAAQRLVRLLGEDAHRGFGGAVMVEHAAAGPERGDAVDQRPARGLAAQHQAAGRQHLGGHAGIQQPLQMAGHDLEHVHAVLCHVAREAVGVEGQFGRHQMQRAPRAQRAEQHGVPQVRRHGRDHGHAARRLGQVQPLQHGLHIVGQRPVADDHALGLPGRARGVDHIGALCGMRRRGRRRLPRNARLPAGIQVQAQQGNARVPGGRLLAEHQHRAAVAQLPGQPLRRQAGVQGHTGATGLEHGEQAQHEGAAALGMQGHAHIGPHAARHQGPGQLVGLPVQLRVVQGRARVPDRRAIGMGLHGARPQLQHAVGAKGLHRACRLRHAAWQ